MPEIPDLDVYVEAVAKRVLGREIVRVRVANPFLLRTFEPSLTEVEGLTVRSVRRMAKRIVIECDSGSAAPGPGAALGEDAAAAAGRTQGAGAPPAGGAAATAPPIFLVIHLMRAGRLHWKAAGAAIPKGRGLAAFDFASGTLLLTEAGTKRRASLHVVRGEEALAELDPGGLEVQSASFEEFRAALTRENHTLKRALTDPSIVAGIGNAYSDEILHRARFSPFKQTSDLSDQDVEALRTAVLAVLGEWTERLRAEVGEGFPENVTAFRPEMAVHGRFGLPCPVCGTAVQRIVYAEHESNYCPRCQTEGKLLADRALSRLLKGSRPQTIEEWESGRPARGDR